MNNKNRRNLFAAGGLYHIFQDRGFSGFVKPHSHSFYQFTVIEQGRITQMHEKDIDSQIHGDVFFTPPGCDHSLFVFGNDTVYDTLSFAEGIMEQAAAAVPGVVERLERQSLFFHMNSKDYRDLLAHAQLLMSRPIHTAIDTFDGGCHICISAVILLLEGIKKSLLEESIPKKENNPEVSIKGVLRFINTHYNESLTLADLVQHSGLSKSSFYSYFGQIAGITPKQYITEKRMHEALRLIRDTELPFNKIAEEVGYTDFSTFFRNFCRMTNESPSDYRNNHADKG